MERCCCGVVPHNKNPVAYPRYEKVIYVKEWIINYETKN